MRESGVQVLSPRGDFRVHPEATDEIEAVADADVVFVGLKAYSLPELAPRLGDALGERTVVIPAQNGIPWWYFQSYPGPLAGTMLESVDPGGVIARSIDPERIVGCVVYSSTEIVAPGVIRHVEGTRFAIGEPDGTLSERCREVSEAFVAGGSSVRSRSGFATRLAEADRNVAFNPVTALTGPRSRAGHPAGDGRAPESDLEECASVAAALDVELPVSLERRLEQELPSATTRPRCSRTWTPASRSRSTA